VERVGVIGVKPGDRRRRDQGRLLRGELSLVGRAHPVGRRVRVTVPGEGDGCGRDRGRLDARRLRRGLRRGCGAVRPALVVHDGHVVARRAVVLSRRACGDGRARRGHLVRRAGPVGRPDVVVDTEDVRACALTDGRDRGRIAVDRRAVVTGCLPLFDPARGLLRRGVARLHVEHVPGVLAGRDRDGHVVGVREQVPVRLRPRVVTVDIPRDHRRVRERLRDSRGKRADPVIHVNAQDPTSCLYISDIYGHPRNAKDI
jgi:hypothetical protein